MKRVVTIVIILALVAGGYFAFSQYQAQQRALAASNIQTVLAERGDLTATVGATGIVRANQTSILAWQTSGTVEKVTTEFGQLVNAGQELAALRKTSLAQNIIMAEADLVNAQKALDELYETDLSLAEAENALTNAKKAVEDAQNRVSSLSKPAREVDIDSAKATVLLAKIKLDKARDKYKPYENKAENNVIRATLFNQLAEAQQQYDAAVRRLNNLQGTVSDTTLSIADSNLALAQAQLEEAQRVYDSLTSGPDSADESALKTRIAAAQATINLAYITAPFMGTITEVHIKPGDQVAPGTVAFRLDDLSHLLLDVQVSEVDINRIKVGQGIILTFDAIPGKEYHGLVTQVAVVGTSNQGVVDFTVTVELTDADEAVKPGMTAAVNVIVEQLEDVLLVPNRAVRVRDGKRVVYVLRSDIPEPVDIVLGASSDTYSEVVQGGLKVGDQIVLNPPAAFEQNGPPPFMRR